MWNIFCRFTAVLVLPFKFQTTLYTWKKLYIFTYLFHLIGNSINKLNDFQLISLALFHATFKFRFTICLCYTFCLKPSNLHNGNGVCNEVIPRFQNQCIYIVLKWFDEWIVFLYYLVTLCLTYIFHYQYLGGNRAPNIFICCWFIWCADTMHYHNNMILIFSFSPQKYK